MSKVFPLLRIRWLHRSLAAALMLTTMTAVAAESAAPKLPIPLDDAMFTGMLKSFRDCRAKYAEMDARIDAAGVRDGSYYRVPGFPYFRTDRFAASYAKEVEGLDNIAGWTRRMREFDQEAREFEYRNLGMSEQDIGTWRYDLLSCGSGLANLELFEDDNLAFLRKQAAVHSEYRPKAAPLTAAQKKAFAAHRDSLIARFKAPLAEDPKALPKLWSVKPVEDMSLIAKGYGNAIPDELGVPALIDSQWRAFAERHAPALMIDTASERDQPGTPAVQGKGFAVDSSQPRMQYHITFTRFGGLALAQLNYFFWLAGDAASGSSIDSFIWRVTLDAQAQPLVYEYVTASGRDYLMFPAQALKARSGNKIDTDAPLLPQADPIAGPVALRIAAGHHALLRVVPLASAGSPAASYTLSRYEDVFTLPAADGKTASLYDIDGRIPGQTDKTQAALWGDRLIAPGALRALGRIPVAPNGEMHFDDARRLDRMFSVPK